ncbi:uncharacterized protein LOC144735556 [Lampetra planeri]
MEDSHGCLRTADQNFIEVELSGEDIGEDEGREMEPLCEACRRDLGRWFVSGQAKPTGLSPRCCLRCGKTLTGVASRNNNNNVPLMRTLTPKEPCVVRSETAKASMPARRPVVHNERQRRHVCGECSKGFRQRYNLERHVRIHTGERPYVCTQCGKGFSQYYNLERHVLIHTGEKPHVCTQCGKGFSQIDTLKRHARMHTGEQKP